jgi:hypothetical protein
LSILLGEPKSHIEMQKTVTKTASIYKDDNDIIHLVFLPGAQVDYNAAVGNFQTIKSYRTGKKYLKLIDGSATGLAFDIAAQHLMVSKNTTRRNIALAILISESTQPWVLAFFNKMRDTKVPTNLFFDHKAAVNWLKEFKKYDFSDSKLQF